MEQYSMSIVTMTAAMATLFLATNENNRKVNQGVVQRYARDMTAGAWRFNGESIKFDTGGRLIDGQHRLLAIIMSGVEIRVVVIRGLPREARDTIDRNDPRSINDVLQMAGVTQATMVSARAHVIMAIGRGEKYLSGLYPTYAEVQAVRQKHESASN